MIFRFLRPFSKSFGVLHTKVAQKCLTKGGVLMRRPLQKSEISKSFDRDPFSLAISPNGEQFGRIDDLPTQSPIRNTFPGRFCVPNLCVLSSSSGPRTPTLPYGRKQETRSPEGPQRPLNIRKTLANFPQSPDKFSKSTLEVR